MPWPGPLHFLHAAPAPIGIGNGLAPPHSVPAFGILHCCQATLDDLRRS